MTEENIMCLCPSCRQNFYDTGAYMIKRVDRYQLAKDACTYCGVRQGYDYFVVPVTEWEKEG